MGVRGGVADSVLLCSSLIMSQDAYLSSANIHHSIDLSVHKELFIRGGAGSMLGIWWYIELTLSFALRDSSPLGSEDYI